MGCSLNCGAVPTERLYSQSSCSIPSAGEFYIPARLPIAVQRRHSGHFPGDTTVPALPGGEGPSQRAVPEFPGSQKFNEGCTLEATRWSSLLCHTQRLGTGTLALLGDEDFSLDPPPDSCCDRRKASSPPSAICEICRRSRACSRRDRRWALLTARTSSGCSQCAPL